MTLLTMKRNHCLLPRVISLVSLGWLVVAEKATLPGNRRTKSVLLQTIHPRKLRNTKRHNTHNYEIAKKSPQNFEGNTLMCTVLTLWQSSRPPTSSAPNGGFIQVLIWTQNFMPKTLDKLRYKICILSFCHISGSNGKTWSWYWLAVLRRHS